MRPGLYEQLLPVATQEDLDRLADPRLYALAPLDPEEAHSAISQFLDTC